MNIEEAKKEFMYYASQYDLSFKRMERKLNHSYRVMENAENIAKSLNLSDKQIELATLIGLIHDIGHFEEIKLKGILKENIKMDHGDYGVEVLKNENYIRKFIIEDKYDDIIFKAIKNHNKFEIEDGLSEEELLFAKIIRDADKLDKLFEAAEIFWEDSAQVEKINMSTVSDETYDACVKHKCLKRKDFKKNLFTINIDEVMVFIFFIFDINFKYDFNILKKEDYINKILDKFSFTDEETRKRVEHIRKIVNEYILKQL